MTKAELIERIYHIKGLPPHLHKKTVTTIVESLFGELGAYFLRSKIKRHHTPKFTYPGFGTFTKTRRKERRGRNPQNGQEIMIPAAMTITFTPGQEFKALLNRHRGTP